MKSGRLLPRGAQGSAARPLADQSTAFLEFCRDHGYEVVASFVDGALVDAERRPGFQQLVEFLKRPEKGFLMVVTPSIDCLGRDVKEAARSWFELQGLGAQVLVMNGDDAAGRLLEAWTKSSQGRVGDKVRSAMRRKAVKGEVLGRPPYGYRVGSRHRLELVPEEAVVVRYIFRLYLQEGLGIRRIARCLNEEAVKTRRGGNWSMVSIRDILRNRAYLGTYSRFGVRVPGSHPALISPDDFRRVQDCLMARRSSYSTPQAIALPALRPRLLRLLRQQDDRRQPPPELEATEGRHRPPKPPIATTSASRAPTRASATTTRVAPTTWKTKCASGSRPSISAAGSAFRQAGDEDAVLAESKDECQELRAPPRPARQAPGAAHGRRRPRPPEP